MDEPSMTVRNERDTPNLASVIASADQATSPPTEVTRIAEMIWSVSALNQQIQTQLQQQFWLVWVRGELSNLTKASSGHVYFTIKDTDAQMRCVMFKQKAAYVTKLLQAGQHVELRGTLGLYSPRGDLQMTVEIMRSVNDDPWGAKFAALQRLKAQLLDEGLFDDARKQLFPTYPRRIGVLTSPQAAAWQDVQVTLQRRAPWVQLVLYPIPVQGESNASAIIAMLQFAQQHAHLHQIEALLLVRGGGSQEDLWVFNDEGLARVIADCALPIATGVGHERDTTLVDWVADYRAATPTAAAEFICRAYQELAQRMHQYRVAQQQSMMYWIQRYQQRIDELQQRLLSPQQQLMQQRVLLQRYQRQWQYMVHQSHQHHARRYQQQMQQLQTSQQQYIRGLMDRVTLLKLALDQTLKQQLHDLQRRLDAVQMILQAHNPQHLLQQGYVRVTTPEGEIMTLAQNMQPYHDYQLYFKDGVVTVHTDLI